MQGNIQIEVLNESAAIVALHLKDVSGFDKQVLVMSLANALDLTPTDILLTSHVPRFRCQGQTRPNGFIEQTFHP